MKIAMIGFGVVGQGFAQILRDNAELFPPGFNPQIVAVATNSRGSLVNPNGLDLQGLLSVGVGPLDKYPDEDGLQRGWDAMRIVGEGNADVVVEAAFSNLDTGMPAITHCTTAFATGKHVVLANKGPVALAYANLQAAAADAGKQLRFEATVMAGTPSLWLGIEALQGNRIKSVRGILNGTTNYILTRMEGGMAYADALIEAQHKGYAEADPSADVDGWDAAGKVLILASAVFGVQLELGAMPVTGISNISQGDVEVAKADGERYKLIAEARPDGGSVRPTRLPLMDPLANVGGATNAVTFNTDLLGTVTLIGPGAGRLETGFALLADILAIYRSQ